MVIVKLKGGLGNQMFQYAFARSIAVSNNHSLILDTITGFESDPYKRQYRLNYFNINEKIASEKDLQRVRLFRQNNVFGKALRLVDRLMPLSKRFYIEDNSKNMNNKLVIRGDIYLDGYWQSYKYFSPICNLLREEFSLKSNYIKINNTIRSKIYNEESVAIHFRKKDSYCVGENVGIPVNNIYKNIDLDYYLKAIKLMNSRIFKPRYFVFTDDEKWVKENFLIEDSFEVVSGFEDYEDMLFMSLCKHQIIANSTFSWWGAWLNHSKNKIVISPKEWFNTSPPNINLEDLLPEEWIKI